jgi:hypothetical protein
VQESRKPEPRKPERQGDGIRGDVSALARELGAASRKPLGGCCRELTLSNRRIVAGPLLGLLVCAVVVFVAIWAWALLVEWISIRMQ